MQTVSEEICGEYLKLELNCNFVGYNTKNPDKQGEIDVMGINLSEKKVFICEVAAHVQGLQYVKDKKPDDYNRLYNKLKKDLEYAKKYFSDYNIKPMFWSPIVKIAGKNAKYNTYSELQRLKETIYTEFDLDLQLIINEEFEKVLKKLRSFSLKETAHFSSPIMRLLQIEEYLKKHIENYKKKD